MMNVRSLTLYTYIISMVFESVAIYEQYATVVPVYDGKFELVHSIDNRTAPTIYHCQMECLSNARCLSFFYNDVNGNCILHETIFKYKAPSDVWVGWKFYVTKYGEGLCNGDHGFLYHRWLGLCYNLNYSPSMQFDIIKPSCQSMEAELVRVDSEARENYVRLITDGTTAPFICIQGTDTIHNNGIWTFDDGTPMTYFNWYTAAGQPNGGAGNIAMSVFYHYKWFDFSSLITIGCTYICEKRLNCS